jgi:hypothetical protein
MKINRTQTLLNIRMLALAPASPMVAKTCPWLDLPQLIRTLDEKGLYRVQQFGEWLAAAARNPQPEPAGTVQILPQPDGQLRVIGWGFIPGRDVPADSVLICKKGADGNPEPWIMLAVGLDYGEAVKITGKKSLRMSAYLETFPSTEDPATLQVFALDEKAQRLYPIGRKP